MGRLSAAAPFLEVVVAALAPEVGDPDPSVAVDGGGVMVIMLVTTLPELSVIVSAVMTAVNVSVGVDVSVPRTAVVDLGLTASIWPKVGSLTSPSTSHQLPAEDLGQARVETLSGS